MPLTFIWIGRLMLVAATTGIIWFGYRMFRPRTGTLRSEYAFFLLASAYPLGVAFKFMVFGPEFLRWHLSDIGFPVYIAAMLSDVGGRRLANASCRVDWVNQRLARGHFRLRMMALGLLISYLYEICAGLLYKTIAKGKVPIFIGTFDWADVVSYTVGAAVGYFLLLKAVKVWRSTLPTAKDLDDFDAQMVAAESKPTPTPSGQRTQPVHKPKRKRK